MIAPAATSALFSLAVTSSNVAWGTPISCCLVWGQAKFVPGPLYTGNTRSRPISWLAITFLVFGIVLGMMPAGGPNPSPQTMNFTAVVNYAVWGGSLAYYFIDARKWFTGPKITLAGEDLTEEQKEAIREEGLQIEGADAGVESVEAEGKKEERFGTKV